jgi:hypothetical protein
MADILLELQIALHLGKELPNRPLLKKPRLYEARLFYAPSNVLEMRLTYVLFCSF